MEIIYPRNTRDDNSGTGSLGGGGGVVENNTVNETFNEWLTQYFDEDNSQTIIETINNYAENMPDVGINELLFAYMAKFESELKKIREAIQSIDLSEKLVENHTVYNFGEYTWNNHTENIYMLTGGVPSTITINQYINNICGVAIFGGEFVAPDAATGAIDISLYPVEYIQTLLENNQILTIDGVNYVPLTICDLTVNDNELGDQLGGDTETDDDTSVDSDIEHDYGFFYSIGVARQAKIGRDGWRLPTRQEFLDLYDSIGSVYEVMAPAPFWPGLSEENRNITGISFKDSGYFQSNYSERGLSVAYWTSTVYSSTANYKCGVSGSFSLVGASYLSAYAIRLVKDAPGVPDGTETTYTDNIGNVYGAIAYGGLYWLTSDLIDRKDNEGNDLIYCDTSQSFTASASQKTDGSNYDQCYCNYNDDAIDLISNGGVTVVDGDGVSYLDNRRNSGLNQPRKVSELGRRALSSVFLRRIG